MKPIYHFVSHTHWDREWYLPFETFRAALVRFIDELMELLETNPEFASFTLDGQTVLLEDYLEIRPQMKGRLAKLIQDGRIFIGPWYVLPDEFLVGSEPLIRNLLMGSNVAEGFGKCMRVGYIPDSFAHVSMMPAIFQSMGIDTAIIYRGFGGEEGQNNSEWIWRSPDGSEVLMIHLHKDGYSNGYYFGEARETIIQRFSELKATLDARATTAHRLVLNGGDHHFADNTLPQTLDVLRNHFDAEFVHDNLPDFVAAVKNDINSPRTVEGELRFGYRYAFAVQGGVYSSRMYLKQANWKCRMLLERYAEPLNALATLQGADSQSALLHHAWKTLLKNHPHDSICGCSADAVHREMMVRFEQVEQICKSIIDDGFRKIVPEDANATGDDNAIFFFNPSPFSRTGPMEATVSFYLQDVVVGLNPAVRVADKLSPPVGFAFVDAEGNDRDMQILSSREDFDISYGDRRYPKQTKAQFYRVLVDCGELPALGIKGFQVVGRSGFKQHLKRVKAGNMFIENEFLRADVDQHGVISLLDKATGVKYTSLNVLEDGGDVGDEYNYSPPTGDSVLYSDKVTAAVEVIENGPLRASLEISYTFSIPASSETDGRKRGAEFISLPVTSVISLNYDSRFLNVETTATNTAADHRLRVFFETSIIADGVYADSAFSIEHREIREYDSAAFTVEQPAAVAPMQRFVTVKDAEHACTIFSEGLPEYEYLPWKNGTFALTLLRCVGLLAGDHLQTRPGGKAGWHTPTPEAQCLGGHPFRYAFYPHTAGDCDTWESINEQAERFHHPCMSFRRKNTSRNIRDISLLSFSSKQVVTSAVKEADDRNGIIVRWWNPSTKPTENIIECRRDVETSSVVRLDERRQTDLEHAESSVHVTTPGKSITTLRITLKK